MNAIIYDCEIIKAIPPQLQTGIKYCKGWRDFKNMGISVIGAYDYLENRYRVFMSDNFDEFQKLVDKRDKIIGFNSLAFDNKLCAANRIIVRDSKSYDLLAEVWKAKGLGSEFDIENSHRYLGLGLDKLAEVNLGLNKTGHGDLAPIQWQQGKIGAVIDYCLTDVHLTKRLISRILETGQLLDSHTESYGKLIKIPFFIK